MSLFIAFSGNFFEASTLRTYTGQFVIKMIAVNFYIDKLIRLCGTYHEHKIARFCPILNGGQYFFTTNESSFRLLQFKIGRTLVGCKPQYDRPFYWHIVKNGFTRDRPYTVPP